jgi:hypothetical protein
MINPGVIAEHDDKAWSSLYLAEFVMSMGEGLGPGRTADHREVFQTYLSKAQAGYVERKIGPRSLAPILLLMRFGLLLMDFDIDPKLKRHSLIGICQAMEGELVKDEDHVTDRACLAALLTVLYRPLMPVWRMLIEYCYTAYKEPLQRLVSGSTSLQAWEDAIRDIWPLLYISKIVPTHDVNHAPHPIIPNSEYYGNTPATYTNEVRTPRPLYTRLFGPAEMKVHADEQKMMEEIFAHLTATVGMIGLLGDRYFQMEKSETMAEAREKGRIAAQQRVLRRHSHELGIPKFFADHLMNELRAA